MNYYNTKAAFLQIKYFNTAQPPDNMTLIANSTCGNARQIIKVSQYNKTER